MQTDNRSKLVHMLGTLDSFIESAEALALVIAGRRDTASGAAFGAFDSALLDQLSVITKLTELKTDLIHATPNERGES